MQLTDIGVECPKCGVKFNSRQLPLIEDTGNRDSELRHVPAVADYRFERFCVCTCPSCGNSDWSSSFPPAPGRVNFQQKEGTPAHLQFRLAAVESERGGRDWFNIGLLYLYGAWCADDEGACVQAKEYRLLAVDSFRKSLRDGSCPAQERVTIEYLIGEILRRAAAYSECIVHFREVIPRLSSPYSMMTRKLIKLAESSNNESILFENGA